MYKEESLLGPVHGSAMCGQDPRPSATNEALKYMVRTFQCPEDLEDAPIEV